MKTLIVVAASLVAAALMLFLLRDYMPGALLILGAVAFVGAYVARSVQADPAHGWPRLAFFSCAASF